MVQHKNSLNNKLSILATTYYSIRQISEKSCASVNQKFTEKATVSNTLFQIFFFSV